MAAEPSLVGRLPATTQPPRRIVSAVVRPTPSGHLPGSVAALIWAKALSLPFGETWTIVVPVPWKFFELLKLLIRMLPLTSDPWFLRTSTVPYGLTSPLAGAVEPIVVSFLILPMKDSPVPACAAGATANGATAAAPAKAVDARAIPTSLSPIHGWWVP